MKLIRDKKLSREDFFNEMSIFFLYVAENISSDNQVLHWELTVDKCNKSTNFDESLMNRTESVTNKSSNEKLMSEDNAAQGIKSSLITEKLRDSENNKNLQQKLSEKSQTLLRIENSQIDTSIDADVIESSNLIQFNALDAIIEATYNMYANELRYALIYAVFVTPIQLEIYHMPHTLRKPRQIKVADPGGSFDIQLRKRLEKAVYESTLDNSKPGKKTTTNIKKEREVMEDLNMTVPPTPPSSLTEEEILANNRRYILPLIEAKEAAQIYEMHAESMKRK
ncbi:uncharacterized protein [Anoplolepis gracilipes]|uniref:uncharacterized protein isoform X2 n=1 Tax=Anoplolepis gracilipes TaxID=354296 RepID=UPI003B9DFB49